MPDVKTSIEDAFKSVLKEKPYSKITVSEICDRACVSRRTFYKYFQDKEAIVGELFDRHVMKPLRDVHAILPLRDTKLMENVFIERMYESIYAERAYYTDLVGPMRGCDDTFLRVATWAIHAFNTEHIQRIVEGRADWKIDYVAYFFASSQAMLVQKWISDGMEVSPAELAELYNSITMPFWERVYKGRKANLI
ncbi:MAG: TetR/AcrR family transcriptional regulator [Eggerthellaceae bacterium]|nr:TetR/AcrR family transcriptional regulator [Eggerthellaceae bacterium]